MDGFQKIPIFPFPSQRPFPLLELILSFLARLQCFPFHLSLLLQPKPHPTLYLIPMADSFEKNGLLTRNHFR